MKNLDISEELIKLCAGLEYNLAIDKDLLN